MTATSTAGPAAAVDHPLVGSVREYAEQVLRPAALRTEREGVSTQRIEELRRLGLLNHLAPETYGGAAVGVAEDRIVHEVVAGACFNTWLVWAQHAPAALRLAGTTATSPLVGRVLRGEALLGAGISDVRRYPHRYVAARRTGGGWTFTGTLSWVSGWGLHDALTVSAVEPGTERVVTALVTVGDRTRATALDLSVVQGSRTERVLLDDVLVPDEQVLAVQSLEESRRGDVDLASDARTTSGWPRPCCASSRGPTTRSRSGSHRAGGRAWPGCAPAPTPSATPRPPPGPARRRTASSSGSRSRSRPSTPSPR